MKLITGVRYLIKVSPSAKSKNRHKGSLYQPFLKLRKLWIFLFAEVRR